jgi:hypothetical protein
MNRRLLYVLAGMTVLVALRYAFFNRSDAPAAAAAVVDSVPAAEKRLALARREAATLTGDEENYNKAAAELADREKTLLKADTVQQAQVALLDLVQNTGRANQVEIHGGSQESRDQALTADYGEVSVAVNFSCGMEQLVNLLTALGNQPELLATNEIQISGGNDKRKNVQVRLVVSAPVPRRLILDKKGTASF